MGTRGLSGLTVLELGSDLDTSNSSEVQRRPKLLEALNASPRAHIILLGLN